MSLKPNKIFLEEYLNASGQQRVNVASQVILPIDEHLIEVGLEDLQQEKARIARERADINEQSGDSWHDGALDDNDKEVRRVNGEIAKLSDKLNGVHVDYPDESEERVSLGSSVSIKNNGKQSILEIVGFAPLHDLQGNGVKAASLEAPVVQQILGKKVGEIALLRHGGRPREIEIIEIEQRAVMQRDEESRVNK